ncbi:MAG: patatin-like phospholipase family protein [Bacteroidota bacterium]
MKTKKINLALQGGGSHGAFTWGVIEALLDDDRIEFDGICGTSAGAMNAVITSYGLHMGGREAAKELLEKFWHKVALFQSFSPVQPTVWDRVWGNFNQQFSPLSAMREFVTTLFSPYQFNPTNYNPLRDILNEFIDFEELNKTDYRVYVCATNVKKGRVRVFSCQEVTCDAVVASACLPYLFQAVEIEGEHYWDGGFMGNPPIFPLIDRTKTPDILLVQINPININRVPKTAEEIRDRINELSFNSVLMKEMRVIRFIDSMIEKGYTKGGKLHKIYMHHINPDNDLQDLGVNSKLNADWQFLQKLRGIGNKLAKEWVEDHFDDIGHETTVDIQKVFL